MIAALEEQHLVFPVFLPRDGIVWRVVDHIVHAHLQEHHFAYARNPNPEDSAFDTADWTVVAPSQRPGKDPQGRLVKRLNGVFSLSASNFNVKFLLDLARHLPTPVEAHEGVPLLFLGMSCSSCITRALC